MTDELKRGDTPTTAVTNEMVGKPGYPAETETGELVLIVSKESKTNGVTVLTSDDGRMFREAKPGEATGLKDYDQGVPDDEPVLTDEDKAELEAQESTQTSGHGPLVDPTSVNDGIVSENDGQTAA